MNIIDFNDDYIPDDTLGNSITIEPNMANDGGLIYEDYNLVGEVTPTITGGMKIQTFGADQGLDMEHALDSLGFNIDDVQMPWNNSAIIGTPDSDQSFWQQQEANNTCAVQAQRGIIEQFTGQEVTEAQLVFDAYTNGWLNEGGTDVGDVGNLLELYGVPCHAVENASFSDLMSELAQGHKVIVGVDSGELWKGEPLEDFFHQSADHATWLTGIDFTDPDHPHVIINDSGDPEGAGKSYDLNEFADSWEDSGFFYVATDNAPNSIDIGFGDQLASYLSEIHAITNDSNVELISQPQDFASYVEALSEAEIDKLLLNL